MKKKNRIAAILLALFFGSFGVHRFYLRKPFSGVLYIIFFWTGIPAVLSVIGAFRFAFMSDEKFDEKYNSSPVKDNLDDDGE
jgi:TM2 domain-containing membrane protein YozV